MAVAEAVQELLANVYREKEMTRGGTKGHTRLTSMRRLLPLQVERSQLAPDGAHELAVVTAVYELSLPRVQVPARYWTKPTKLAGKNGITELQATSEQSLAERHVHDCEVQATPAPS